MPRKKYDLAVKVGSYEKNGETKNKWQNIGAVMEGDNGPFMFLEPWFNPAGVARKGDSVMVSMFEPKGQQNSQQQQGGGPDLDGDSIPFAPEWRL